MVKNDAYAMSPNLNSVSCDSTLDRGVKTHSGLCSERIRFPRGGGNFQTSGDNI